MSTAKTKAWRSLLDSTVHVRCSIIGQSSKAHLSLMDWFLGRIKTLRLADTPTTNGMVSPRSTSRGYARALLSPNLEAAPPSAHIPGNVITKQPA